MTVPVDLTSEQGLYFTLKDGPTLNLRVLMLQSAGRVDRVHARELEIECVQRQQAACHTHVVTIAGEGRTDDQHHRCAEQRIAAKAQIWLQSHGDLINVAHTKIYRAESRDTMGEKESRIDRNH